MRSFSLMCLLLVLTAMLVSESQAAITRFEAEVVNNPPTVGDSAGYDKYSAFWGDFSEAGNSNGMIVYSTTTGAPMKFLFCGTGVNLIVRKAGNGGTFTWSLDDGAATGSYDCFGNLEQQISVPIATGLSPTFHTLEITAGPLSGTAIFIDAFDVENSTVRSRYDDADPAITYTGPSWGHNDAGFNANIEASAGAISYYIGAGGQMSASFTGCAVALILCPRQDSVAFNWSIDGGAYTGTVDPQPVAGAGHVAGGIWYRYPFVLKNDLPDTSHTLTVTTVNAAAGANFIGIVDAIDFVSNPLPVELSTFDVE